MRVAGLADVQVDGLAVEVRASGAVAVAGGEGIALLLSLDEALTLAARLMIAAADTRRARPAG